MHFKREGFPRLYPILDASLLAGEGASREELLRALVGDLIAAGVTLFQYRNKSGNETEVLADVLLLREAAPPGECRLILNDFPALAAQTCFDGAHVGQEDMAAEEARAVLGVEKILGISTHNPEQLGAAELTSADYLAIGPVFSTRSKLNPDPVVGIEGVQRARELTTKPLVAIGGITLENCRAVIDAGADSVAVISGLFANTSGMARGKIASDFFAKLR